MHTGENYNKCSQCDFACSGPSSLRRHMKKHRVAKLRNITITTSRHPKDTHKKHIKEFKCISCATLYQPWQMKEDKTINFKTLLLYDCFVRCEFIKSFYMRRVFARINYIERRNLISSGLREKKQQVSQIK